MTTLALLAAAYLPASLLLAVVVGRFIAAGNPAGDPK